MNRKKQAAAAFAPEWARRKALRPTPDKFFHVSVWYEWFVEEGAAQSTGYYRAVGKPRAYQASRFREFAPNQQEM